ncbi:MAG: PQQ-binding-like beta-propeller repeat protein [Planctomycetes bacterium]|nr:PQQ-binding-like beta-propeller repeat protein [Planctomycetota bacterium]
MTKTRTSGDNTLRTFAARRAALAVLAAASMSAAAEPTARAKKGDWPMWGGSPDRNMVSDEKGIPAEWDISSGKNIKWKSPLGSQSYGNPVVSKAKIFIGTNNGATLRPNIKGDKGIVLCIDEKSGKLLWQATHDKLPTGRVNDWPEQGICSSPVVDGDKLYYVSNRCELVCADVEGFLDGENDGPYREEKYNEKEDADFVWILDMIEELGVFPHNLATSSPVIAGDTIFILTSNGVDEGHLELPSPTAPAFIAVDRKSGKVLWTRNDPGKNTYHGQWSSPAYGVMGGKPQALFGGGDGWCYSLDPKNGELIWKFDLNPKDAVYVLGGKGTRNEIISTPVIHGDTVYLAVGQDPEHGEGPGHFYAIDATKTGDVTESAKLWHVGGEDFHRTISSAAVADGLVYAADLSGYLYCFDQKTGKQYWRFDTLAAVWGSPYVVDGKVMLGDEDGEVHVLAHGKELKELATNSMANSVYTTPVAANGVLFVANRRMLYAIEPSK